MKTKRISGTFLLLIMTSALTSTATSGAVGAPFAGARAISDEELSSMRGGFFTAAGAQFDFGASIKTLVNGQLALQTNVNWTAAGAVVQQLSGLGASIQSQVAIDLAKAGINAPSGGNNASGSVPVETLAPISATASNAAPPAATAVASAASVSGTPPPVTQLVPLASETAPTTVATITNIVPAAGAGTTPPVISGVQIQSATGATQILTNVSAGQLQNIIVNTASNQTITQNTNLVLAIYNFTDWQKQIAQNTMSAQLAREIMAASSLGGSR